MLELDDIQHILLTRTPALTGRYEFLSFQDAAAGRAWLSRILEQVVSAAEVITGQAGPALAGSSRSVAADASRRASAPPSGRGPPPAA